MEVTKRGRLHYQKVWECVLASWIGYLVAHGILLWLHERPEYPKIEIVDYHLKTIFSVIVLGVVAGLGAVVPTARRGFALVMRMAMLQRCGQLASGTLTT